MIELTERHIEDFARDGFVVVAHCCSSQARFHSTNVGAVYGRYKRHGTLEMDESFFPVLWREDGYRSPIYR
jgi:hypothetical protein